MWKLAQDAATRRGPRLGVPRLHHTETVPPPTVRQWASSRIQLLTCTLPHPQTDPLLEHLSAREQLLLVCGLRGLPPAAAPGLAARLLSRCALPPASWDAACGTLSGGNKRKVALAAALVGQPAACLLDEPSAGGSLPQGARGRGRKGAPRSQALSLGRVVRPLSPVVFSPC